MVEKREQQGSNDRSLFAVLVLASLTFPVAFLLEWMFVVVFSHPLDIRLGVLSIAEVSLSASIPSCLLILVLARILFRRFSIATRADAIKTGALTLASILAVVFVCRHLILMTIIHKIF